MTKTTIDEKESDLQQQLKKVEYDTLDGERCHAQITEISQRFGEIKVTVELPSGREHTEGFKIPDVASERYRFVRLLKTTGYGLSTLDHAVGADVTVKVGEGTQIVVPEREKKPREKFAKSIDRVPKPAIQAGGIMIFFLTAPISTFSVYQKWHKERWGWDVPEGETLIVWILMTMLWLLTVGFALLVLMDSTFL